MKYDIDNNLFNGITVALYHINRCKIPGFLAPIQFQVHECPDEIHIIAEVSSWPQYPEGNNVIFYKYPDKHSMINLTGETSIEKDSFEEVSFRKKVFRTSVTVLKKDFLDKSLYAIADNCNQVLKNMSKNLCSQMVEDLWEC